MPSESDLYAPVKRLLEAQGYTVRGEVHRCDLVAVRGDEPPVIVELKRSFELALLYQGIDRQRISDAVYLAVAAPASRAARAAWRRNRDAVLGLCRRLGLGLITVGDGGDAGHAVEVHLDPLPYRPRPHPQRRSALLREFMGRAADHNVGGSRARPLITAYRQDALRCLECLSSSGPLAPAVVRRRAGVESAARILQRNVYGWFARVQRGVYTLSPEGRAALDRFADVLATLRAAAAPAAQAAPGASAATAVAAEQDSTARQPMARSRRRRPGPASTRRRRLAPAAE